MEEKEREREDEQRVPRQNYCVRLTNPYRNVCNPPDPCVRGVRATVKCATAARSSVYRVALKDR